MGWLLFFSSLGHGPQRTPTIISDSLFDLPSMIGPIFFATLFMGLALFAIMEVYKTIINKKIDIMRTPLIIMMLIASYPSYKTNPALAPQLNKVKVSLSGKVDIYKNDGSTETISCIGGDTLEKCLSLYVSSH